MRLLRNRRRLAAGLGTTALLGGLLAGLSGCGLGTAGGYVPTATLSDKLPQVSLKGASIAVGSKNFSENILLGKMALILFKSAGADVKDLTNIPGSSSARQAELDGAVGAMWEYTGTGWINYLGHDKPVEGEQKQYDAVRKEDLADNDLVWLPPAPMNNTYSFAITQDSAKKYGITKLSQMKKVPAAQRTFCVESEFSNRPDGLNGVLKTYDVPLGKSGGVPEKNIQLFQTGAIYDATAKGDCTFGEVFTTDGRIKALNLTVLEDDRHFFPAYNVSLVVRRDVLHDYPQIKRLIAPVAAKLTNKVLLGLNARIDVDGEEQADVAHDWLQQQGFIK